MKVYIADLEFWPVPCPMIPDNSFLEKDLTEIPDDLYERWVQAYEAFAAVCLEFSPGEPFNWWRSL